MEEYREFLIKSHALIEKPISQKHGLRSEMEDFSHQKRFSVPIQTYRQQIGLLKGLLNSFSGFKQNSNFATLNKPKK